MANQSLSLLFDRFIKGKGPLKPRAAALLLMIAGAVSFIVSLVAYGEQVLCLFGSTLVVFAGLGINVIARRQVENSGNGEEPGEEEAQPVRGSSAARNRGRGRMATAQTPAPATWGAPSGQIQKPVVFVADPAEPSWRGDVEIANLLAQKTTAVLRRQGADVQIVNQREDRSILHVVSPARKGYSILINEGHETIDVNDIRGLYSVMVSTGAEGAIYVTANAFTTQAQEWAQKRAVLLVEGSRVEEIEI